MGMWVLVWFPRCAKDLYQAEPWGDSDFQEHFGLSLIRWWKPLFCSNAFVRSSHPVQMRLHFQPGKMLWLKNGPSVCALNVNVHSCKNNVTFTYIKTENAVQMQIKMILMQSKNRNIDKREWVKQCPRGQRNAAGLQIWGYEQACKGWEGP